MDLLHGLVPSPSRRGENGEAVVFRGVSLDGRSVERLTITYKELWRCAGAVRHGLLRQGSPSKVVAVYSRPHVQLPSVLLGVLQAGFAFFPVSRAVPQQSRLAGLEELDVHCALVHHELTEEFTDLPWITGKGWTHEHLPGCKFVLLLWPTVVHKVTSPTLKPGATDNICTNCTDDVKLLASQQSVSCLEKKLLSHRKRKHDSSDEGKEVERVQETAASATAERSPSLEGESLCGREVEDSHLEGESLCGRKMQDSHLAYVMKTSGTTGRAKTVRVPHCCIVPNILHLGKLFHITSADVVMVTSPYTFDPFVVQVFIALSSGAQLVLVADVVLSSPRNVVDVISSEKVTVLQPTPSLFYGLGYDLVGRKILAADSSLRVLAFGGEPCPSKALLKRWKSPQNKTLLFDIYGITEVSCWATCHSIILSSDDPDGLLGEALDGTTLKVFDSEGRVVLHGEGHLWIGGQKRVCLLSGEKALVNGKLRPSGDVCEVNASGQIILRGRVDRQLKRFGKRLNLDSLQQTLETSSFIDCCFFVEDDSHFPSGELSTHCDKNPDTPPARLKLLLFLPKAKSSNEDWQHNDLWSTIRSLLPSHAWPDQVIFVDEWPVTCHGKIDQHRLCALAREAQAKKCRSEANCDYSLPLSEAKVEAAFRDSIERFGDVASRYFSGVKFLAAGGDSVMAIQLAEILCERLQNQGLSTVTVGLLVDCLLHQTVADLKDVIFSSSAFVSVPHNGSLRSSPSTAAVYESDATIQTCCCSVHRGGRLELCQNHGKLPEFLCVPSWVGMEGKGVCFQLAWRVDCKKCVDASPLVILHPEPVVVVGSHSHCVVAVKLENGQENWRCQLPDRVEASAALSRCGQFVIVGCYDSFVYVISAQRGRVVHKFKTGDAVKSSAVLDHVTGWLWVGSHDGKLHCIDVHEFESVFSLSCGGGSVFASPCVDQRRRIVYAATLAGHLTAFHAASGNVLWRVSLKKPLFSSPALLRDGVCIGSVDHHLWAFDSQGLQLWSSSTNGCVFASPCVSSPPPSRNSFTDKEERKLLGDDDRTQILIGSYDEHLFCFSALNGCEIWHRKMPGRIYATCSSFPAKLASCDRSFYAVACTTGQLMLVDWNGAVVCNLGLKGEVFSSPVLVGRFVVFGCRDNFLYCLELVGRDPST